MNDESTKAPGEEKPIRRKSSPTRGRKPTTQEAGSAAEALAAAFLRGQGYKILGLNWRCRSGEIDILAEEGEVLVFVEVKLRGLTSHGRPGEAVTYRKQARIANAAALYAVTNGMEDRAMRFDIVEMGQQAGGEPMFRLWRNAFTPRGPYLAI